MFDRLRRITVLISVLVVVLFTVFVVNQTAAVVDLADRAHPWLGQAVLWTLVALYVVLVATPLWMYFRLPPPITPPATESGPEYEEHLDRLRRRLEGNALVDGPLGTRDELAAAVTTLDRAATDATREAATQVFLSTAISQSGRLDTFVVLGANARLVWRIARIYYQRPTLRDMWHLYANVAATAFLAGELDDVDVSEQVQPIVTSVIGSLGTALPGLQVATSLIVNSVLSGSTNAFLTLRVGAIAQQYCAPLLAVDRRTVRRSATARAAGMLGAIVGAGSRSVVRAVARASRDRLFRRRKEVDYVPDPEAEAAEEEEVRRWWRRSKRAEEPDEPQPVATDIETDRPDPRRPLPDYLSR